MLSQAVYFNLCSGAAIQAGLMPTIWCHAAFSLKEAGVHYLSIKTSKLIQEEQQRDLYIWNEIKSHNLCIKCKIYVNSYFKF